MKKLLLLLLLVFAGIVLFRAYDASQNNGKSLTYNLGKEGGKIVKDGVETTKDVVDNIKEGIDDSN